MNAYVVDTNHLSPIVTLDHPLRNKILTMVDSGQKFIVPSVVLHEFMFGIGTIKRAKQNLQEWESLRHGFAIYHVDAVIAHESARLRIRLRKQGWQLDPIDSMVAMIALWNQQTLLTTDKDFRGVPQLQTENWLKE